MIILPFFVKQHRHCEERSNLFAMQIREKAFVKKRSAKQFCTIECPV